MAVCHRWALCITHSPLSICSGQSGMLRLRVCLPCLCCAYACMHNTHCICQHSLPSLACCNCPDGTSFLLASAVIAHACTTLSSSVGVPCLILHAATPQTALAVETASAVVAHAYATPSASVNTLCPSLACYNCPDCTSLLLASAVLAHAYAKPIAFVVVLCLVLHAATAVLTQVFHWPLLY